MRKTLPESRVFGMLWFLQIKKGSLTVIGQTFDCDREANKKIAPWFGALILYAISTGILNNRYLEIFQFFTNFEKSP